MRATSLFKKIFLPALFGISSLVAMTQTNNVCHGKVGFNKPNRRNKSNKSYYTRKRLANIDIVGRTTLNKVVVKKSTKVEGYLHVEVSQLNTLDVQGRAEISDSIIKGDAVIQGKAEIDHGLINTLTVQGKLIVRDSTIKGLLDVQGKVKATNTIFEDAVPVMGVLEATEVIFKKEVYNFGKLIAKKTSFNASLTGMLYSIDLHDVTTQDIYVNKKECCKGSWHSTTSWRKDSLQKKQLITLSGETIVNGTITFESGEGIVRLGKKAKINGNVIGGTIQKL